MLTSFVGFYSVVELLLFANRDFFGTNFIGNNLIMLLVSFLNLVPSGLFAFSIVSALPEKIVSESLEETLLAKPRMTTTRFAVLYTTYNDFIQDDAEYNCEQAIECCAPFFVLDDSNDPKKIEEVNIFVKSHECRLVRRKLRKGFKAGAMNNWVNLFGKDFDYMFILDSDSRASSRAMLYCAELAARDTKVALVQTKTMTMTTNSTRFTESGVTIQHAYMAVIQNAMKKLGSSPYYGHNALIKVGALRTVGGFVEESNEDYKTLARMHHLGYASIYASNAITWEEIPPDYFSARKRSLRWARDAVGQLGLLRFRVPLPMAVYLFYGWVTYMANIALLSLLVLLAVGKLSLQISNMGAFASIAGIMTISVIVLWPLLSLRVKDPVLTVRRLLKAVAWGTIYNMPMLAPTTLQIARTTIAKITNGFKSTVLRMKRNAPEEFIVTPKVKQRMLGIYPIISSLRTEFLLGLLPIVVAIFTSATVFLLFSIPESLSILLLPVLLLTESKNGLTRIRRESSNYLKVANYPARHEFIDRNRYVQLNFLVAERAMADHNDTCIVFSMRSNGSSFPFLLLSNR
ncbi:MAG: glycosyltransferase family 2 protein [Nitrososphaerales archaeon]